jgi:hypothetical protein
MKKALIACAIAAATSVAASGAVAAGGHGGGSFGGHGGFHGSGFSGGHFRGGDFHGGHFRGGHFRGGFRGSVFVGFPAFWWPAYYGYGYPYPYYYDYPYATYYDYDYAPSTTYIERVPSATAPGQVQYYCPDGGYYPAVRTCAKGWLRVVPDSGPPQSRITSGARLVQRAGPAAQRVAMRTSRSVPDSAPHISPARPSICRTRAPSRFDG